MTPDYFDQFLERIETTIDKKVNGKIDRLEKKLEAHNERHEAHFAEVKSYMEKTDKHIEETKPIIEAYRGVNTVGNLVKWVAGVGTALGVLWVMLMQLWRQ